MEKINQEQKAEENSTQVQIAKVENNYGLTLEDVNKIVKDEVALALKEQALIANDKVRERLNDFSNVFIPKLVKANMLDCFSDPAVQMFFRNTEKTAICTDNINCYEILSEILIHRVQKKDDYTAIAATNRAVEIADKISEDALLFLTIFLCVNNFYPNSGNIKVGFNVLDQLYGKIMKGKTLPFNRKIIDNLEIVGAIKVESLLSYKRFEEFFPIELEGYSCAGIEIHSESYKRMKDILASVELNVNTVCSESLIENHIRINVPKKERLKTMFTSTQQEKVNNALEEIYKLYDNSNEKVESAKKEFLNLLENYPNIVKVKEWWNANIIDSGIKITPVGRVLAHVNAKNLDSNVPDLD